MLKILEKLFYAADNHGEDTGEPDHTVGDLQDMLRQTWKIMTVSQKLELLDSETIEDLVIAGAQGEFEVSDLVTKINQQLDLFELEVTKAGYSFFENEDSYRWELSDKESGEFTTREDTIEDAHAHFLECLSTVAEALPKKAVTKVIVLCINSDGSPELHSCEVQVSSQQRDDGEHYELAKQNAGFNGYVKPMIAFDVSDEASRQLPGIAHWLTT